MKNGENFSLIVVVGEKVSNLKRNYHFVNEIGDKVREDFVYTIIERLL